MELVTALIKSLPKQIRKNFVPAPDVARQAVAALEADFDPATDELEPSLELVLRRIRGQVIPPGSWNWDAVPAHLRVSFRVVDSRGKVLDEGKDLGALQERLAPATRRAIAESLGATPGDDGAPGQGKAAPNGKGAPRTASAASPAGASSGGALRAATPAAGASASAGGFAELSGLKDWTFGTVERQVQGTRRGAHRHRATPPWWMKEIPWRCGCSRRRPNSRRPCAAGVIRLLALKVPPPDRYVLEHLNNTEKLTFSQNPHGSVTALIADCALAAIDKLTPAELPWNETAFKALYENVRAELIDTVFTVTAVVERILASTRRIEKQLKGTTSLALISALNDVKSQLEQLVYPGFVARTGYAQLSQLPRYLAAIEKRLEKLPGNVQRDAQHMAAVQALEDDYDDAVSALLPGRRAGAELTHVRWMIEELRVSLFAVELGTAYSVSEKRIRAALNKVLAPA